jgi:hypothetical protein
METVDSPLAIFLMAYTLVEGKRVYVLTGTP